MYPGLLTASAVVKELNTLTLGAPPLIVSHYSVLVYLSEGLDTKTITWGTPVSSCHMLFALFQYEVNLDLLRRFRKKVLISNMISLSGPFCWLLPALMHVPSETSIVSNSFYLCSLISISHNLLFSSFTLLPRNWGLCPPDMMRNLASSTESTASFRYVHTFKSTPRS